MRIDVYADVVCPWCYIGERRLAAALALRPKLQVDRRWQPFQLQPTMPRQGMPWAEFVQRKFGAGAQAAFEQVTALGAAEGLAFDFDRVASAPNTVDAHRLILWAARHNQQWALAEALFAAYFNAGCDLNQPDQVLAVVEQLDLPPAEASAVLAGSEGLHEVAASQQTANQLGITGVPCLVIDQQYALVGAQSVAALLSAFDQIVAQPPSSGAEALSPP